jgi:hypothetical protein
LLADDLTREDMERLCCELVDEGHRDVQLVESQYTAKVIKQFDKEMDATEQHENAKLLGLVTDMCACFQIGAERDGISKQWCYELFDSYTRKLRELGIEVK